MHSFGLFTKSQDGRSSHEVFDSQHREVCVCVAVLSLHVQASVPNPTALTARIVILPANSLAQYEGELSRNCLCGFRTEF